jgi:hypothetical protein
MGVLLPPVGSRGKAPGGGQAAKSPEAEGIMIAEKTFCAISEQFFMCYFSYQMSSASGSFASLTLTS